MNPILAIELKSPVEPNHEDFLNTRSFVVGFKKDANRNLRG
jgi:hypothetical protein